MRRENDFYPTPAAATLALLASEMGNLINGRVLEPCVGAGDMALWLRASAMELITRDVDPKWSADFTADAQTFQYPDFEWVITNPPFNCALEILKNLLPQAKIGVAMLLRVTFLEPTIDRGPFFKENPPSKIIHMPRVSFTGDGKVDSAHACWFIWAKSQDFSITLPNKFVTKPRMRELTEASARYLRANSDSSKETL